MNHENSYNSYLFSRLILVLTLIVSTVFQLSCQNREPVPAFPGALGGGMYTTGGREGKVIKITNLNDRGPGSFRDAINSKGKRTIIFDVSGTIELKSQLRIKNGDVTIAGQTAPGDGICIKGQEVRLEADNIIIRFVRFRPGDIQVGEYDAITGFGNKNIIIDHCSMSWSTDETVSFYDNENFTLQWCIVSESLNNSHHRKGEHGYGGIWGGYNASFLFNLLAHHNSRNPRLQGTRNNPIDDVEKVEIINNIVYNWRDKAIYGGENGQYNIISNILISGPATQSSGRDEILEPYQPFGKFFLEGNVFITENGQIKDANWKNVSVTELNRKSIQSDRAFGFKNMSGTVEALNAYDLVLKSAGASLFRDTVDHRIVKEVKNRTFTYGNYGIINSQKDTEGWPVLNSTPAPLDSDGDGIPDEWEKEHSLDFSNPTDGNAYDLDPDYTNLEVYLNSLVEKSHNIANLMLQIIEINP
jgi:hypothetical protein